MLTEGVDRTESCGIAYPYAYYSATDIMFAWISPLVIDLQSWYSRLKNTYNSCFFFLGMESVVNTLVSKSTSHLLLFMTN